MPFVANVPPPPFPSDRHAVLFCFSLPEWISLPLSLSLSPSHSPSRVRDRTIYSIIYPLRNNSSRGGLRTQISRRANVFVLLRNIRGYCKRIIARQYFPAIYSRCCSPLKIILASWTNTAGMRLMRRVIRPRLPGFSASFVYVVTSNDTDSFGEKKM